MFPEQTKRRRLRKEKELPHNQSSGNGSKASTNPPRSNNNSKKKFTTPSPPSPKERELQDQVDKLQQENGILQARLDKTEKTLHKTEKTLHKTQTNFNNLLQQMRDLEVEVETSHASEKELKEQLAAEQDKASYWQDRAEQMEEQATLIDMELQDRNAELKITWRSTARDDFEEFLSRGGPGEEEFEATKEEIKREIMDEWIEDAAYEAGCPF
ncbi:hypothetical protein HDV00_004340 [Rhizophlyctis rosea]|nr:hypothetical protein HDV00_004340 [Rhizophlyctis rosea]